MRSAWKSFFSVISLLSAIGPARSVPGHVSHWWGWKADQWSARTEKHHAVGQRRTHDLRHEAGPRALARWQSHAQPRTSGRAAAGPPRPGCSSADCISPLLDGSLASPDQSPDRPVLQAGLNRQTEPLPLPVWVSRHQQRGLTRRGGPAPSQPGRPGPAAETASFVDGSLDVGDTERFVPRVVTRLAMAAAHVPLPPPPSVVRDGALPWLQPGERWARLGRHPAQIPVPTPFPDPEPVQIPGRVPPRVRRGGAKPVCERERFGVGCGEPLGPPSVQDSNVVMVGGKNSATITALRRCGRQLRFKVRELAGIPAVLYRFRDHSALYQLLVYVSSDGGAAAGRQLQRTLRAMAELFGGYSLVYLPEPVPSELTALAYEFCQHRAGPCRWTDDLGPVLAATRRLTRNSLLLNAYDAEGKLCDLPCGGAGVADAAEQVAGRPMSEQLQRLTELWCSGRWHTVVEIVLPSEKPSLTPTKPQTKSSNSLAISDILPVNMKLYDKNRPPKYRGDPTTVYFHVTVITLDSINEESMTYVADVFLAQSWRDHRLRLPENMTEEYRILDVNWLLNIWRPDCIFKNAKKVTFHEMSVPNHYLWLYKDKTLLYMSKLTLVLSCAMKFEAYPHDTQSCSMMIESLSHTTYDLIFKWNVTDPLMVNPEIELPQLDIAKNITEDCTLAYSTGNFTCLAVVFHLRRRLGYHLFHTYIPSALIVVMSWISFWIKPEAIPARVTLGVTSLLTLATQNQQSQQSLPPVSYVKAIDVWMSSCSVFVFSSLMEFAVVNNFMGPVATKSMKGYSDEDVSNTDEKSVRSSLSRSRRLLGGGSRTPPLQPQYVTFCHGREVALYIDKMSRYCFPLAFVILNVVYWTSYVDWEELGQA